MVAIPIIEAALLLLLLLLQTAISLSQGLIYTNTWAVEIQGCSKSNNYSNEARRLAEKHGFAYTVKMFSDYHLFEHKNVVKWSTTPSHYMHVGLQSEPNVHWLAQQVLKSYRLYSGSSQVNFNDEMFADQWYIKRSQAPTYNVIPVWEQGITGEGIVVAVVDDGLDKNHPELRDNYDGTGSYDFVSNEADPGVSLKGHGNNCAGVIAGVANNGKCGVGIAYKAKIAGIRLYQDVKATDATTAQALGHKPNHNHIYSNSWGPSDFGYEVEGPGPLTQEALKQGTEKGREGLGSIFVFAVGNGGLFFRDCCSYNGYVNSIYTIAISGVSSDGSVPGYAEYCPGIMAVTYSRDPGGVSNPVITAGESNSCDKIFAASSAATAMASGLIALTLQANKRLTWRDMQHIIVRTARSDSLKTNEWNKNKANFTVSHYFGFGLMDAARMVSLAKQWRTVPNQIKCEIKGQGKNRNIPPSGALSLALLLSDWSSRCEGKNQINYLEHVQVLVNLQYSKRGDILIDLTSPSGTVSHLTARRWTDNLHNFTYLTNWTITTLHFWGEKALGTWQLSLKNAKPENKNTKGTLFHWSLFLYGTETDPARGISLPTDAPTPTKEDGNVDQKSTLSAGAISGIVVAIIVVVVAAFVGGVAYWKYLQPSQNQPAVSRVNEPSPRALCPPPPSQDYFL